MFILSRRFTRRTKVRADLQAKQQQLEEVEVVLEMGVDVGVGQAWKGLLLLKRFSGEWWQCWAGWGGGRLMLLFLQTSHSLR